MTTDKARKRAVRSRMTKTGERYAAARRHVVNEASLAPVAPPTTAVAPPADPGWSDETIVKGTGRDWAHWLDLLDAWVRWSGPIRRSPAGSGRPRTSPAGGRRP